MVNTSLLSAAVGTQALVLVLLLCFVTIIISIAPTETHAWGTVAKVDMNIISKAPLAVKGAEAGGTFVFAGVRPAGNGGKLVTITTTDTMSRKGAIDMCTDGPQFSFKYNRSLIFFLCSRTGSSNPPTLDLFASSDGRYSKNYIPMGGKSYKYAYSGFRYGSRVFLSMNGAKQGVTVLNLDNRNIEKTMIAAVGGDSDMGTSFKYKGNGYFVRGAVDPFDVLKMDLETMEWTGQLKVAGRNLPTSGAVCGGFGFFYSGKIAIPPKLTLIKIDLETFKIASLSDQEWASTVQVAYTFCHGDLYRYNYVDTRVYYKNLKTGAAGNKVADPTESNNELKLKATWLPVSPGPGSPTVIFFGTRPKGLSLQDRISGEKKLYAIKFRLHDLPTTTTSTTVTSTTTTSSTTTSTTTTTEEPSTTSSTTTTVATEPPPPPPPPTTTTTQESTTVLVPTTTTTRATISPTTTTTTSSAAVAPSTSFVRTTTTFHHQQRTETPMLPVVVDTTTTIITPQNSNSSNSSSGSAAHNSDGDGNSSTSFGGWSKDQGIVSGPQYSAVGGAVLAAMNPVAAMQLARTSLLSQLASCSSGSELLLQQEELLQRRSQRQDMSTTTSAVTTPGGSSSASSSSSQQEKDQQQRQEEEAFAKRFEGEKPDIASSILQLKIGPDDALAYQRGLIVGNQSFLIFFVLLNFFVGFVWTKVKDGIDLEHALMFVRFPSLVFLPGALLVPATSSAVTAIAFSGAAGSGLDIAMVVLGAVVGVAAPLGYLVWVVWKCAQTKQRLRTKEEEEREEMKQKRLQALGGGGGGGTLAVAQQQAGENEKGICGRMYSFLLDQEQNWNETKFFKRHGIIYEGVSIPFFSILEVLVSIIIGFAVGSTYGMVPPGRCLAAAAVSLGVLLLYMAALFFYRPYLNRFEKYYIPTFCVVTVVTSALVLAQVVGGHDLGTALEVMGIVTLITGLVGCYTLVDVVMAIKRLMNVGTKKRKKKKKKNSRGGDGNDENDDDDDDDDVELMGDDDDTSTEEMSSVANDDDEYGDDRAAPLIATSSSSFLSPAASGRRENKAGAAGGRTKNQQRDLGGGGGRVMSSSSSSSLRRNDSKKHDLSPATPTTTSADKNQQHQISRSRNNHHSPAASTTDNAPRQKESPAKKVPRQKGSPAKKGPPPASKQMTANDLAEKFRQSLQKNYMFENSPTKQQQDSRLVGAGAGAGADDDDADDVLGRYWIDRERNSAGKLSPVMIAEQKQQVVVPSATPERKTNVDDDVPPSPSPSKKKESNRTTSSNDKQKSVTAESATTKTRSKPRGGADGDDDDVDVHMTVLKAKKEREQKQQQQQQQHQQQQQQQQHQQQHKPQQLSPRSPRREERRGDAGGNARRGGGGGGSYPQEGETTPSTTSRSGRRR